MSPSFQNPPGRLSPEREAEIVTRRQQVPAGPWRVEPCAEEATKYCLCIVSRRTEDDGVEYIADAETPGLATWIAHAREDIDLLLAELDAVRAERDMYRDRALDAENRSIVDGREVCADCERPVPDPCTVHSPDAVFQRGAREAAQLRVDRDRARARVAELRRYVARLEAAICQCEVDEAPIPYVLTEQAEPVVSGCPRNVIGGDAGDHFFKKGALPDSPIACVYCGAKKPEGAAR